MNRPESRGVGVTGAPRANASCNGGAAKAAVNSVPVGSEYTLQAQYLLGVVLMKETLAAAPAAVQHISNLRRPTNFLPWRIKAWPQGVVGIDH